MKRSCIVALVLAVGIPMLIIISVLISMAILGSGPGLPSFGDKVALIRVEGVITSGRGGVGLFSDAGAGSEKIVKQLERARKDTSVRCVVMRINSPGGSAAASQEVYNEMNRVRKAGKKITVSMGDVAASGGYYIASAADRIFADPATLTGSIGVIMETTNMKGLFGKLGLEVGAIKSGKHKDMGSPARALTLEEKQIMQSLIDDVFAQFVTDVHLGRKLPVDYVKRLADGRVYTGSQALKLKLVDRLGGLEDAVRFAARDAGISGHYETIEYGSDGFFSYLLGDAESRASDWNTSSGLMKLARTILLRDETVIR